MRTLREILSRCTGFEWDVHNAGRNWKKHRVWPAESEQVFFNRPLVMAEDKIHSGKENRFYALSHTDAGRRLFVVFTVRGSNIRVISARDMSDKERSAYEKHEKEDTEIQ